MNELTQFLATDVTSECLSYFQGTIVEDYWRNNDVVIDMQNDYFRALNDSTFAPPTDWRKDPDATVVSITPRCDTNYDTARERITALAAKRGLKPINNTVFSTGAGCFYMECK